MDDNNKDNITIIHPHFKKVFNNHSSTYFSLHERIKQPKTMLHVDDPIAWDEFNQAINGLNIMKESGFNRVRPEEFEAMDEDCRRYVFDFINAFCRDRANF